MFFTFSSLASTTIHFDVLATQQKLGPLPVRLLSLQTNYDVNSPFTVCRWEKKITPLLQHVYLNENLTKYEVTTLLLLASLNNRIR